MLLIVADQIVQRETIVRGDKIDAGVRASPVVLVQVGASAEPVRHLADASLIAFPKTANRVAVFSVPFRPRRRKIPDLIAALADVPRFRN